VTLREVLVAAAAVSGPTSLVAPDGGVTWERGGRGFATLDADGVAATFRLDAVVADAARRTPDASASPGGPEWVTFIPGEIDGHAADRASAWFAAAERRAAG